MNGTYYVTEDFKEAGFKPYRIEEFSRINRGIIKANKELIVLSILKEKPMCGYDILKMISSKYNVTLSQSTIYPVLYYLEDEYIISSKYDIGNMKSKKYSITPKGRELTEKGLESFVRAIEGILVLIKEGDME